MSIWFPHIFYLITCALFLSFLVSHFSFCLFAYSSTLILEVWSHVQIYAFLRTFFSCLQLSGTSMFYFFLFCFLVHAGSMWLGLWGSPSRSLEKEKGKRTTCWYPFAPYLVKAVCSWALRTIFRPFQSHKQWNHKAQFGQIKSYVIRICVCVNVGMLFIHLSRLSWPAQPTGEIERSRWSRRRLWQVYLSSAARMVLRHPHRLAVQQRGQAAVLLVVYPVPLPSMSVRKSSSTMVQHVRYRSIAVYLNPYCD